MKHLALLAISFILSIATYAQSSNAIVGKWLNDEKDGKVEIYETGGKFYGKLVWLKNTYQADGKTLRKDSKNKDAKLRERTLLNALILTGFRFDDGKWVDGQVYDPKSGKTYSCEIKIKNGNMEVRGYVGSPMFGRTATFTKTN
jgi:uncharacterized protein (DUF2147 family)